MSSLGSKVAMLAMLALRPRSPAGSAGFHPHAVTIITATTPIHMFARAIDVCPPRVETTLYVAASPGVHARHEMIRCCPLTVNSGQDRPATISSRAPDHCLTGTSLLG